MISRRTVLRSTAMWLRKLVVAVWSFAQFRIQKAHDVHLLSMLNTRELDDLGLSRNQDNDSFYHRD
jgi:uncharacterized protein YjiS (DUF1127 family)